MSTVPSFVLDQFSIHNCALIPIEHLGFSGSTLWKVQRNDSSLPKTLCLKRWSPTHPPPARLPWIHQVLQHARQSGIDFVPEPQLTRNGQTTCEANGATWELMTWLPGEVESSLPPSRSRVQAAFRALARFHQVTANFAAPNTEPAPAFAERTRRWEELTAPGSFAKIVSQLASRRIPEIDDLAQQWPAKHLFFDPHDLQQHLQSAAQLPLRLQPAIRDVWRDHVLFAEDEVAGIIDFGAMRIDTPLTDLARLLGSLAGDDQQLRNAALDAYSELIPLSTRERDLIDLLDRSSTLIAGWNWLDWLYVEERQFPSLSAVRARLTELLRRKPLSPLR